MRRLAALVCAGAAVLGCDKEHANAAPSLEVHTVVLPRAGNPLPELAGKKEYAAVCTACHSPLYITDQPELTKDGWGKVVDKMKKNYGAPVPEELTPAIVDYLALVRGKHE